MTIRTTVLAGLFLLLALLPTPAIAQDPESSAAPSASAGQVIRGVFFFSPTCPHCEHVIANDLPGIFEAAGGAATVSYDESLAAEDVAFYLMSNGALQLLMVDASAPAGGQMFGLDSERLGLTRAGVPRLDIGDGFHVGSVDIPAELPGLIDAGLADTGIGWPEVPGLTEALLPFTELDAGTPDDQAPADGDDDDSGAALPATTGDSPLDRIGRDPLGNGISIVVLLALVVSLIAVPVLAVRGSLPSSPSWLVPVIVIVGIGVAAYLASIETSGREAVCGPVGDCNAVQASEYASLAGVPIGVLGMVGYVVIGGLWTAARFGHGKAVDWALVGVATGALLGAMFSAYLTFLEPFVIGATCMWCITSALLMLVLLWVTAGDGWAALQRLRGQSPSAGHHAGGRHSAPAAAGH